MNDYSIRGKTVTADLYGVDFSALDNEEMLVGLMIDAATKAGATVLKEQSVKFRPNGVTVACILSESHITCHSYPEKGFIAVDCYTCGEHCDPEIAIDYCIQELNPQEGFDKEIIARGKRGK
jgi:S-adenosylmethionine decarboxylase